MPTPTTAWMQEVERRRKPKPSVQGGIYSESWVKAILFAGFINGQLMMGLVQEKNNEIAWDYYK